MEIVEIVSKYYDNTKDPNKRLILRGMLVGQHLAKLQNKDNTTIDRYMKMALTRIIEDETKNT